MINIENVINIVVCEDDCYDMRDIQQAIKQASIYFGFSYNLESFSSAEQFLEHRSKLSSIQLIITDIYMNRINGIALLQKIKQGKEDIPIAIVTSSVDYGIDAFRFNALHYILKPITQGQINEVFKRLFDKEGRPIQYLTYQTAKNVKKYPIQYIKYIQSNQKGIELYFEDYKGIEWLAISSVELEKQLERNGFIRLNRSAIVNLKYIDYIEYDICYMKDKKEFAISRGERKKVERLFEEYVFKILEGRPIY